MPKVSVIAITEVLYLKDYLLQIYFSDDTTQNIDFPPFLSGAKNPVTRKYLDKKKFRKFHINHGDLMWGDFEMCFPIWDLHEGKI